MIVLEIAFSSNLQHAKFQSVLPHRLSHGGPLGGIKAIKFYPDFLQYNFRKLVQTLENLFNYVEF